MPAASLCGRRCGSPATLAGRMAQFGDARWYAVRRAGSTKPATYRCPLCGRHLPALTEHLLVVPEGDSSRRRHAHTKCVMRARKAGRLPLREEVEPRRPGLVARLVARVRGREA
jgi:hypothetical protein